MSDKNRRETLRSAFRIGCHARAGTSSWFTVFLHDLSTTGFKMQWPLGVRLAERVSIRFPGLEVLSADVRWKDGQTVGCEFSNPLSKYVYEHLLGEHGSLDHP